MWLHIYKIINKEDPKLTEVDLEAAGDKLYSTTTHSIHFKRLLWERGNFCCCSDTFICEAHKLCRSNADMD